MEWEKKMSQRERGRGVCRLSQLSESDKDSERG